MAWIDRQVPEGDEIFYDYIGYFVTNLETAGAQLEKLGFQVSAINIQYNENEAGELIPTGTSTGSRNLIVGLSRCSPRLAKVLLRTSFWPCWRAIRVYM